ncbi:hypothetical protein TNCT_580051 [Trichonephila clavata]|uniref:Uncharacterized protein n=1 Tax=Trichonephila clavata TaxID=2740835 RepID=A0A8X6G987_TRICU|nr:hypothetical protein TNCT_580051 [Trichonephila clavata]
MLHEFALPAETNTLDPIIYLEHRENNSKIEELIINPVQNYNLRDDTLNENGDMEISSNVSDISISDDIEKANLFLEAVEKVKILKEYSTFKFSSLTPVPCERTNCFINITKRISS